MSELVRLCHAVDDGTAQRPTGPRSWWRRALSLLVRTNAAGVPF